MAQLDLAQARVIVDEALLAGRRLGLAPLSVAVVDARGVVKVLVAEDGTSLMRNDIATAKAVSALNLGIGGRALAARAASNPGFFASLHAVSRGRMVPVLGSVLVRAVDGELIGAVGVSGDTAANDEACAMVGVEASGLKADAGEAS